MAFSDDRPPITFGHVQRRNSRRSLPRIDRCHLDIQRRRSGKPLFHAVRANGEGGEGEGGGREKGWTTLWHDGGRKNSLSSAPRWPLILLSFRSHGIYSRALFSEDLTKKLRPSNSFESRRAYREIINRTVRHDAARRLPLLLPGKSREKVTPRVLGTCECARDLEYLRRRSRFRHIERVFPELPSAANAFLKRRDRMPSAAGTGNKCRNIDPY